MSKATQFDLGLMGLGTMGMNLLLNMADHGHNVAGYSRDEAKVTKLVGSELDNLSGFIDLQEFVKALVRPRVVLLLVPAGAAVDGVIKDLLPFLEPGDFIVDGGNSFFRDTARRVEELKAKGIGFIGMGVSGGESGARRGPSMMPGGSAADYERLRPMLESASAKYNGEPCVALMGNGAAGHYVKMVHNGIEYGLMQAYAEGFDILKNANIEALPAEHRFDLDIADIAEVWRRGSVIPSWLLDLTASALAQNHTLDNYSGFVEDSGEGRWTVNAAVDEAVPAEVLTAALYTRFRSRKDHTFAEKILSAMRAGFGGHKEPPKKA